MNNIGQNRKKKILNQKVLQKIVDESVHRVLNEIYVGGDKVDFSDWSLLHMNETEDGYYEFEAVTDNHWYRLRGTYHPAKTIDSDEILLDDLIAGHSGFGRSIQITDKLQRWFDTYASKNLIRKLRYWLEHDYYDKIIY